jgi:cell division protein ZapA
VPENTNPVADEAPRVVTVEIMGQRYPIKSALDPEYITGLAEYVDEKIQSATDHSTGSDAIRVTVLAALNIADEYFRARDSDAHHETELQRRTGAIEQMIDRALEQFD